MSARQRYLRNLTIELRARGLRAQRIVEETAAHLDDLAQGLTRDGQLAEDAERAAQAQFGSARAVAARFASERFGLDGIAVLIASLLLGAAICWMDNRPHWDDTGITALALLTSGGLMALLVPRRPWLWALAIWIFLPVWNAVTAGGLRPGMLAWAIVLAFPLTGALLGTLVRRRLARTTR